MTYTPDIDILPTGCIYFRKAGARYVRAENHIFYALTFMCQGKDSICVSNPCGHILTILQCNLLMCIFMKEI